MSKLIENIRIAFSALVANKLRAVLTTIGISIGIGAVIILISMGNAAQDYITNRFLSSGANLITVSNGFSFGNRGEGAAVRLSMRDVSTLQNPNNVSGLLAVVPVLSARVTTSFGVNTTNTGVSGTTPQYFDVQNRALAAGRLFNDGDLTVDARVAVIGQTTAQTLFTNGEDPLGQTIMLGSVPFKVIGMLQASGSGGLGQDLDDVILVPLTTAQSKLVSARNVTGDQPISNITLEVADPNQVEDISNAVTDVLRTAHQLKPTAANDFTISSAQDRLTSLSATISTLTTFLAVVGGISLVVGGIGVMNIMLVTVTERTREIGLRKAVGAKFRDIVAQFLTESVVLSFVGGTAGLILAFVVTGLLRSLVQGLNPTVSLSSVVLAVSVVTIVGIVFGIYPASRAASLSPIQALHTE
jgi:putative ABC transport system permease protein